MPLNLPIDEISQSLLKGCLYVVATPIGNLGDVTLRAVAVLANADLVAAEDTRVTARLLAYYGIRNRLVSCHEYNEAQKTGWLIDLMKAGQTVAIVSNAGTPTVSDPGYRLVSSAVAHGIKVVPIPGACAAVAALSASGLPTDSYLFVGFLPKKPGKQHQALEVLANEPRTLIFYESPRRLLALIEALLAVMGDRPAVLTRELTKIHEEFLRGRLSELNTHLKLRKEIKGECILLVHGIQKNSDVSSATIREELQQRLQQEELPLSELSKEIARKHGVSKQKVYKIALQLKKQS